MSLLKRVAAPPPRSRKPVTIKPAPRLGPRSRKSRVGPLASLAHFERLCDLLLDTAVEELVTCCETLDELASAREWLWLYRQLQAVHTPVKLRAGAFVRYVPQYRWMLQYQAHPVVHTVIVLLAEEHIRWRGQCGIVEERDPEAERAAQIFAREQLDDYGWRFTESGEVKLYRVFRDEHDSNEPWLCRCALCREAENTPRAPWGTRDRPTNW